jgi:hypothetical protein
MRDYLPLVFEVLLAAVVIGWGVRELILLNRDKADEEPERTTQDEERSDRG